MALRTLISLGIAARIALCEIALCEIALCTMALCTMALAAPSPGSRHSLPAGYRWQAVPQLTNKSDSKGVDTKKWRTYNPCWNGREPSRFEPGNVSVAGGRLRLRSDTLLTYLFQIYSILM